MKLESKTVLVSFYARVQEPWICEELVDGAERGFIHQVPSHLTIEVTEAGKLTWKQHNMLPGMPKYPASYSNLPWLCAGARDCICLLTHVVIPPHP